MQDCKVAHLIPTPRLDISMLFPGIDELQRRAKISGEALMDVVEHANPSEMLDLPEDYKAPMIVVLIGVIGHGIEHRTQVATLLSMQGIKPPRLDVWGYNNEML